MRRGLSARVRSCNKRIKFCDRQGFTLIELMIVVAAIGILVAITIPLFSELQRGARITKAQADLRSLASAVSLYSAHMAKLPGALPDLMLQVTNDQNQQAGPFMNAMPTVPLGWNAYAYAGNANGTFSITGKGDGTTITVP